MFQSWTWAWGPEGFSNSQPLQKHLQWFSFKKTISIRQFSVSHTTIANKTQLQTENCCHMWHSVDCTRRFQRLSALLNCDFSCYPAHRATAESLCRNTQSCWKHDRFFFHGLTSRSVCSDSGQEWGATEQKNDSSPRDFQHISDKLCLLSEDSAGHRTDGKRMSYRWHSYLNCELTSHAAASIHTPQTVEEKLK